MPSATVATRAYRPRLLRREGWSPWAGAEEWCDMVAAALQEMFLVMADAKGVIARNQFTVASLLQALMMHACGLPRCLW